MDFNDPRFPEALRMRDDIDKKAMEIGGGVFKLWISEEDFNTFQVATATAEHSVVDSRRYWKGDCGNFLIVFDENIGAPVVS